MALALAVLLCLASGFALVSPGWTREARAGADLLLRVALAVGFGLGIVSLIFFLSLLFHFDHLLIADFAVSAILLMICFLLRRKSAGSQTPTSHQAGAPSASLLNRTMTIAFVLTLVGALYSAVMRMLANPHGEGWDAFAIWNLHARFLFRGGANWRDGFTALLPGSHPDYPLLLPAAVAHFWKFLGYESTAVPAAIGFLFTFSTVGMLSAALSILRGRTAALLGAIALLATPSFIEQGTAQYADVPLSFFMLATIVLLIFHSDQARKDSSRPHSGLLALAGIAVGFAAWTKNEGLLFLCALLIARGLMAALNRTRSQGHSEVRATAFRQLATLIIAAAPLLLLIACFKHSIAPQSELFPDSVALHKLLDPARYWAIVKWYCKGFFLFGRWLIPGTLLLVGLWFVAGREDRKCEPAFSAAVLSLLLTLAGFFAIYLITPYDLYWHLRFSLYRLILQLWPSTIFLYFLKVKLP